MAAWVTPDGLFIYPFLNEQLRYNYSSFEYDISEGDVLDQIAKKYHLWMSWTHGLKEISFQALFITGICSALCLSSPKQFTEAMPAWSFILMNAAPPSAQADARRRSARTAGALES
jgi:hypothetical protein